MTDNFSSDCTFCFVHSLSHESWKFHMHIVGRELSKLAINIAAVMQNPCISIYAVFHFLTYLDCMEKLLGHQLVHCFFKNERKLDFLGVTTVSTV